MDIKILHLLSGAERATGLAVVIDVFRAFSLECYIMEKGAAQIIPVKDISTAYQLKEKNPEYILVGERHGKIMPGFDYGNSPSQIKDADFTGKTIIHTTSAGTQGLMSAKCADEVITGSLVNAAAIANYIRENNFTDISLVCMGLEAIRQTQEDTLCAEYIKSLLKNEPIDIKGEIEKLKLTDGSKFFDKTQNDVFPEQDFYLCTQINKFNFILKLKTNQAGTYIKKHTVFS